ncbi:hypothetical protein [Pluralibacter gergoviae]|uniref:hypothetical protein n=1 Tax=Pluralibacter gergoviae TaxID=61647 RepID=UPI002FDB4683
MLNRNIQSENQYQQSRGDSASQEANQRRDMILRGKTEGMTQDAKASQQAALRKRSGGYSASIVHPASGFAGFYNRRIVTAADYTTADRQTESELLNRTALSQRPQSALERQAQQEALKRWRN